MEIKIKNKNLPIGEKREMMETEKWRLMFEVRTINASCTSKMDG